MSFAEGSCKDTSWSQICPQLFRAALTWQESGYDQPAGSQSFTVLLTDVQLALYHKAPLLWLTLGLFLLSWPFHSSIGKASLGIQIWVLLASVCRETSCIAALFKSSMHCMRQCVLCRTSNDVTRIAVFTSFRMFSEFRECFVGLFPIVCAASWHLCTLTDFGSPLQIHDLSRCSDIWLLQQAVLEWMTFSKFHLQTVRRYQFFCVSE